MFTVLDFLVQHHYVQKYSASFAENFYDLKRVPSGDSAGEKLSKTLQWRSILNLVGVPYLKQKLEQLFQDLKYKEDMLPRGPDAPLKARLCRAFLGIYPFIHMLWEGVALWHILAYAFKQSCWHSFPMHLSGTELRHRTEDDAEFVIADMAWTEVVPRRNIGFAAVKLLQGVVSALSTGLSVSIFFLQFLDWWYNSDASAPSLTALPMPSPPQRGSTEASRPYVCPLCTRTRTNETALAVSGYVFCFPCIHEYIRIHGCCPVTGIPAKTEHLIKIYLPDS
ncbi:peroxisome assembly protein 12-like isoform X2 [Pomacea canaliculata]|nr:peroxisome assembly protein 12-like isoform X2 [Pomacea canaliculata]